LWLAVTRIAAVLVIRFPDKLAPVNTSHVVKNGVENFGFWVPQTPVLGALTIIVQQALGRGLE